ncbi:hypothetical protein POTOM_021721 [Populus tomentosa]|uniref:Light-harvesting complex-like protein OHP2, chloroplastic n=1 Tax=Populus tomentosa TaxID=118781 RepID=A0A8X7ZN72_POPTO|nr:hypothetical protein POTOM_021721 [Populus tomentosa]
MSVASSIPFSTTTKPYIVTLRSSQAEGPIRRPVAPPLREPSPPASPSPPLKPVPPSSPSSPVASPPKPAAKLAVEDKNVMTLEFQRQKAKELQEYFKQKKLEEADRGPFFGFSGKNEIANGRLSGFMWIRSSNWIDSWVFPQVDGYMVLNSEIERLDQSK